MFLFFRNPHHPEAIRGAIEKIQDKSAFQGTFNENVFCDSFDTRL